MEKQNVTMEKETYTVESTRSITTFTSYVEMMGYFLLRNFNSARFSVVTIKDSTGRTLHPVIIDGKLSSIE